MSKDWKVKISALGGINESNLRKVFLTKTRTIGVKKYLQP
jgi:hypothetical protein